MAESRLPAGQRLNSPDFSVAPRPRPASFPPSDDRVPPLGMIHFAPYLEARTSPLPSASPRSCRELAPSAGPPGGSTLGTRRGTEQRRWKKVDQSRTQGHPFLPPRVTHFPNTGQHSGGRSLPDSDQSCAGAPRVTPLAVQLCPQEVSGGNGDKSACARPVLKHWKGSFYWFECEVCVLSLSSSPLLN